MAIDFTNGLFFFHAFGLLSKRGGYPVKGIGQDKVGMGNRGQRWRSEFFDSKKLSATILLHSKLPCATYFFA